MWSGRREEITKNSFKTLVYSRSVLYTSKSGLQNLLNFELLHSLALDILTSRSQ